MEKALYNNSRINYIVSSGSSFRKVYYTAKSTSNIQVSTTTNHTTTTSYIQSTCKTNQLYVLKTYTGTETILSSTECYKMTARGRFRKSTTAYYYTYKDYVNKTKYSVTKNSVTTGYTGKTSMTQVVGTYFTSHSSSVTASKYIQSSSTQTFGAGPNQTGSYTFRTDIVNYVSNIVTSSKSTTSYTLPSGTWTQGNFSSKSSTYRTTTKNFSIPEEYMSGVHYNISNTSYIATIYTYPNDAASITCTEYITYTSINTSAKRVTDFEFDDYKTTTLITSSDSNINQRITNGNTYQTNVWTGHHRTDGIVSNSRTLVSSNSISSSTTYETAFSPTSPVYYTISCSSEITTTESFSVSLYTTTEYGSYTAVNTNTYTY